MRRIGWLILLFVATSLGSAVAQPATVITGATLIDGTGSPALPNATIIVRGKRITAVGPRATVAIPAVRHDASAARTISVGVAPLSSDANT